MRDSEEAWREKPGLFHCRRRPGLLAASDELPPGLLQEPALQSPGFGLRAL